MYTFFFSNYLLFFFLWLHPWHMEVPGVGVKSELHLPPKQQLMATLDPKPTEQGQGLNPHPHGDNVRFLTHLATMETLRIIFFFLMKGRSSHSPAHNPQGFITLGIKSLPWSTRSCRLQVILPLQASSSFSFPCSLSSSPNTPLSASQTWPEPLYLLPMPSLLREVGHSRCIINIC